MAQAHVNRIATAVPANEIHDFFRQFVAASLHEKPREQRLFIKMSEKAGIERRHSCIETAADAAGPVVDRAGMFRRGAFPGTGERMDFFKIHAPDLAMRAIEGLKLDDPREITHLVVASCTGMSAPGLDLQILRRLGLDASVERTLIGFMGCYAAVSALKAARHIVRSEPDAKVLVVNCELCTLHLKETTDLEQLLTFSIWGDGASAALVTSEPVGIRLDGFKALLAGDADELMTWNVCDDGFDMVLSGQVPATIQTVLQAHWTEILGNRAVEEIDLWAVHPGGRSVLDAIQKTLRLDDAALTASREVLRDNGNMSSATVMFVLEKMLADGKPGEKGIGMAFGPGLTAETVSFEMAA
ncbi:type III polyketide synthase [Citreimonas salinaria]|uniref:Predicted naringenin-chalcone synthase n=1 Tax=Citreimonas salinaria TaxID=321339 RepID=A0A1H3NUU9_9RHOB|nr:type III polyketide synthase [Citreimonas salinaria]SDY92493.1 Predicted naringenin-chalcone synthase [Citreimonas salinaria]